MRPALLLLAPGLLGLAAAAAGQSAAPAPATDPLPPGPDHDLTLRVCSRCHAPQIIAKQRMSPERWKETVDTMASRGATATDEELDRITAYLARSFPEGGAK